MPDESQTAQEAAFDLISLMVQALVDVPSCVQVDISTTGKKLTIQISAPSREVGRLVGRTGRNAIAMRTILAAWGAKRRWRVQMSIAACEV